MSYWRDEDFQQKLLMFVCRDRNFLKRTTGLLSEADFAPKKGEGSHEAYMIAQIAFRYYRDYREPVGGMLRTEVLDYVRANKKKVHQKTRDKLLSMVDAIRRADGLVAVEAIERKVIEYKQRQSMTRTIRALLDLKESGDLTPKKFYQVCRNVQEEFDNKLSVSNYDEDLEKRIKRRQKEKLRRFPYIFIDCIDREVRTIPKKELGVVLARYKRGKSTAAVHLAQAYAIQGHNVLLFTLEDAIELVEDRMDASFTGIPIKDLAEKPNRLRKRLRKALQRLRGRIKIIDGTDGRMSVQRMEEIWENYRNQGFDADTIIIDYDEKIDPPFRHKGENGERLNSIDIYKELKSLTSRRQLYTWVLAQTGRGKRGVKRQMIVTGNEAAIDISKIKMCAMCISIGDGPEEFGSDGRYLFIAAHRYDKQEIGWPIKGDFARSIFYDRDATEEALATIGKKKSYNKDKEEL